MKYKKYNVVLSVGIDRLFSVKADSKEQAKRVIDKIISHTGIDENGIRNDSAVWSTAPFDKDGLAIDSLTDESAVTYSSFEFQIEKA